MSIRRIYLSWRKERGSERRIVGVLHRYGPSGYNFRYLQKGIEIAQKEGFINYPEFPDVSDLNFVYTEGIQSIFSLRLIPEGRQDRERYLSFWEANDSKYDWFDQLALTQGTLPTDNFEFLGVYTPPKVQSFVTDIANLTKNKIPKGLLQQYDLLSYTIEDNIHDFSKKCVKVFLKNKEIGYIKQIHNLYFTEAESKNYKVSITVKVIDEHEVVNQLYVLVNLVP